MATCARIPITVESYSGYKADEYPLAIRLEGRRVAVQAIVDRWYGEDHAYFKLTGEDGALYLIRQDRAHDRWELILMQVPAASARSGEGSGIHLSPQGSPPEEPLPSARH
jgi:hypothetical protein